MADYYFCIVCGELSFVEVRGGIPVLEWGRVLGFMVGDEKGGSRARRNQKMSQAPVMKVEKGTFQERFAEVTARFHGWE